MRYLHVANHRVVGGRDFFGRTTAAADRPLHVGLTRTEPDFAKQNVLDFDRVATGDLQYVRLLARFDRGKTRVPPPLVVALDRHRLSGQ